MQQRPQYLICEDLALGEIPCRVVSVHWLDEVVVMYEVQMFNAHKNEWIRDTAQVWRQPDKNEGNYTHLHPSFKNWAEFELNKSTTMPF